MGGLPTPENADRVVEILEQVASLTAHIEALEPEVMSKTKHLRSMKGTRESIQKELGDLMRKMDCDSPGNFGWEGRMSWLVAAVVARVKAGDSVESTPKEDGHG